MATEEELQMAQQHILECVSGIKPNALYSIHALLQAGYPIDLPVCRVTKQTILMKATATLGCPLNIIELALQFRPNINLADSSGRTALHLACQAGRLDVVQRLNQVEGIDVNCRTTGGETPLMKAVQS